MTLIDQRKCGCPGDCNCHFPDRLNICGCMCEVPGFEWTSEGWVKVRRSRTR